MQPNKSSSDNSEATDACSSCLLHVNGQIKAAKGMENNRKEKKKKKHERKYIQA